MSRPLPAGPAPPLHYDPAGGGWWTALLALAVLLALALLLRWWWRRRAGARAVPESAPPRATRSGMTALEKFLLHLSEIRRETIDSRRFRDGCHRLALALRDHLALTAPGAGAGTAPFDTLTAREIRQRLGRSAATEVLVGLADLRFGEAEPERNDFERAFRDCWRAVGGPRGKDPG